MNFCYNPKQFLVRTSSISTIETGMMAEDLSVLACLLMILQTISNIPPGAGLPFSQTTIKTEDVCRTESCNLAAKSILRNMDPSVDPCDDFYRFACGGFLNTTIPDDKPGINSFTAVTDKVQQQLRIVLEKDISINESRPFKLAKTIYKVCMNKSAIEMQGLDPLIKVLKAVGGWPVLEGTRWNENKFNWIESTYKLNDMGYIVDYFMSIDVDIDLKNSSRRVIFLDQALSMERFRNYLDINKMKKNIMGPYLNYLIDIAVILGADPQRAREEMSHTLDFARNIKRISLAEEKRRDLRALYNPMKISELAKRYPSIPWKEYINRFLPSSVQVDDNEVVILMVPNFFKDLEMLISKTPKRIQANYMIGYAIEASIDYLNDEIRRRHVQFSSAFTGEREMLPRWKECVGIVDKALPISTGALYVQNYLNKEIKQNAIDLVKTIRDQFYETLQNLDWMDDSTRKNALEKATSISEKIAYPEELLEITKLEEFYKDLEFSENTFLQTILDLRIFKKDNEFKKLKMPVQKNDWTNFESPTTVNSFYLPSENTLYISAGILQGNFLEEDRPRYMNYASIGSFIGHEIIHGFDDVGRQFDKDGKLFDWWATPTKEKFLRKVECIVKQYSNYIAKDVNLKLNGIITQGENIADNGGVKGAYLSYKKWSAKNGPEPKLPGLSYTNEQMFWISASNVFCAKYRPEYQKIRIARDFHSLDEFRIIGPFSNLLEFSHDFNCHKNSKMNPTNKCVLW